MKNISPAQTAHATPASWDALRHRLPVVCIWAISSPPLWHGFPCEARAGAWSCASRTSIRAATTPCGPIFLSKTSAGLAWTGTKAPSINETVRTFTKTPSRNSSRPASRTPAFARGPSYTRQAHHMRAMVPPSTRARAVTSRLQRWRSAQPYGRRQRACACRQPTALSILLNL